MTDNDLAPLVEPIPAPRRTDAAFARAVADDVRRRRSSRNWMFAPLLAAVAAGVALFVAPDPKRGAVDAGIVTGALLEDEESLFALPVLEGSTEEELERLERALDNALQRKQIQGG